jgi:hypothetical protein
MTLEGLKVDDSTDSWPLFEMDRPFLARLEVGSKDAVFAGCYCTLFRRGLVLFGTVVWLVVLRTAEIPRACGP